MSKLLFDVSGRRVLITGGAVHIGRGLVDLFADADAHVGVAYCSHAEEARALAEAWRAKGRKVEAFPMDVRCEDSVRAGFLAMDRAFGGLDVLINNAGIFSLRPQAELTVEEWDRIHQVNLRGVFLCVREALQRMEGGAIVNIASINGLHPGMGPIAHYDASKGGVVAYTRSLALELAPRHIRVNAIAPGLTDSDELRTGAPELVAQVTQRSPLKTLVHPRDIAAAALYLSSPASACVTGTTLVVDGGYLLT